MADQVHVFDRQGELLFTVGGTGDGPGEFRNIRSLFRKGDSLWVHDLGRNRVAVFDAHGEFARSFELEVTVEPNVYDRAYFVAPLTLADFVVQRLRHQMDRRETVAENARQYPRLATVRLRDPRGGWGRTVEFSGGFGVEVRTGRGWVDAPAFFKPGPHLDARSGRVAYAGAGNFDVAVLDSQLVLVRRIRWPNFGGPLDPAEVDSVRASQQDLFTIAGMPEVGRQILRAALAEAVLPRQRPALGGVILGTDGSLWAGRFEPVGPPVSWWVLAPDGRPLGRLALPKGNQLRDVLGDRLLLMATDTMGVERLEIRRVDRDRAEP